MTEVPANAIEVMKRFSNIRPMLDRVITNSEYVIGSYVMTICLNIAQGATDEEIVADMAKHGISRDPRFR
jgi:hypothetical protein